MSDADGLDAGQLRNRNYFRAETGMKILRYGLILLAFGYPTQAWAKSASDYFPICSAPGAGSGRTLTVDPSSPRPGSYSDIASALKAAKPGDTISLMSGDYGELKLSGMNQSGFITIAAAPGQTPRFSKLSIGGYRPASHWRISGLTVSGFSNYGLYPNGWTMHKPLVTIGNSDNIIFERSTVQSQAGEYTWQPEIPGTASPTAVSQGVFATQSSCMSIVENKFSNVWSGVETGGDQVGNNGKYILVSGNIIDNYAGDGIDHYASHIRIEGNRITNGHNFCDNKCVHNDGIQGWNFNNRPGLLNTDIIISGNEIVGQTVPNLPLPADALQGITIFNGNWDGVHILNNVVVVNAWHGITVYGARNVSITNNTVAPQNPSRNTWITYGPAKDAPPAAPGSVIIRNNVARNINTGKNDPAQIGAVLDHNLTVRSANDFSDIFVKFDLNHFAFDLHPSLHSDTRGEGTSDGAPSTDIEGNPRGSKVDIGAYAYKESQR
ncbi:MAG: right-handed parallel beta-helix repeat-containing protein [Alphaproteobacteria bacterium]|nr:right-handed parallel beta-helix repeat-containing protein [Alphaproteobacteria bacterium]